jgi:hypothetical protein
MTEIFRVAQLPWYPKMSAEKRCVEFGYQLFGCIGFAPKPS